VLNLVANFEDPGVLASTGTMGNRRVLVLSNFEPTRKAADLHLTSVDHVGAATGPVEPSRILFRTRQFSSVTLPLEPRQSLWLDLS
jgi:hypothetical protein